MNQPNGAHVDGEYRYVLWRYLGGGGPAGTVLWVMLNPSTADAVLDDATIRKVMGFSRSWGFSTARVVNLYALRSRDPKALLAHADPVGPQNDAYLVREASLADGICLAWGANAKPDRAKWVTRLVLENRAPHVRVWTLGRTLGGEPKHPLMLGYTTPRTYEGEDT